MRFLSSPRLRILFLALIVVTIGVTFGVVGYTTFARAPLLSSATSVVFNGDNASGQQGLWDTNGTTTGTTELGNTLNPSDITVLGNQALFNGYDTNGNSELWGTDGTASAVPKS
jgi:hypothetical protein